jgi:Fic family protein
VATTTATPQPQPLGRHEERFWTRNYDDPLEHQKAGRYRVFIPDNIAERDFTFTSQAVTVLSDASRVLSHLQETRPELISLAALARNLLRSESAASSRIEGILISHRNLARAAYARTHGRRGDNRAAEVLGNVDAMERAVELGASAARFTVESITDVHCALLRFTEDRGIAGQLRQRQNWIGGNDYHPIGAAYVGPPHEYVPDLLEDLCGFVERTDVHPVAQAAIAHAQFENIHPFNDGNGRTGRAFVYAVLRHRGETPNYIPPISLALGAQPKNYVNGLGAYSTGNVSAWCELFARATMRAAREAEELAATLNVKQQEWIQRLGQPRSDAAVRQIISALPGQPIIDVPAGQQLTGKSHVAVGSAIDQLEQAGVLTKLNERKWGRVWECRELLSLVEEVENRIATP